MERIDKFEKMLSEICAQANAEQQKMDELKAEGKEKTATYRQYLGNKLMFKYVLDQYKKYGLIEK